MQQLVSLLPIIGIALLFWLLIIRPASKRQKELSRMQGALTQGDDVMLTAGIFGAVTAVEDDHVLVRVADGVTIKVARGAVANVVPADNGADGTDPASPREG